MHIEIIKERIGSVITVSDCREATPEEVARISALPCEHATQMAQLVVDVPGVMYDYRYCAVCGASLGVV